MKRIDLFEYGTLKNAHSKYLYRGLRKKEVDAGIRLIPKGIQTFEDLKLYKTTASGNLILDNLGPILSVFNHIQGLPTLGVSTSTLIEVAIGYALASPVGKQYVVMINREKAKSIGVKEYIVKDKLPLWRIQKPDDEEVILTSESRVFSKELIERIYNATELSISNLT